MTKHLEEIKEILKYIDQFVYVDQTYNDIKLSKIDTKLILDYITNLQQKYEIAQKDIESLKNNYNDLIKMSENKIDNLQQENEILRKNAEHNDKVVDKSRWNDMICKSRCEKAIEYIKEQELLYYSRSKDIQKFSRFSLDILNILQGSDEE